MDREQQVCPVCGQPVATVVRRHKTLGAWVPRWVPGPCRNPGCEACVPEGAYPESPYAEESEPEPEAGQEQEHERGSGAPRGPG